MSARYWLLALLLICAVELTLHSGSRSGFLQSSRPLYSANDLLPADGYVSWAGTVPVLHDSDGVFTVVSFFLGGRGTAETGILDRRAAYAYLASLTVPWAGAYVGFMVVNLVFWWGAAAAAYWYARRQWADEPLARVFSLLIATGQGFIFMAGVPMSYLAAYACLMLLLALGTYLGAFSRPRLGAWLLLGWGAGVASTIYFTHYVALAFWWLFGLRRVPWRFLVAATVVALGISTSWELFGHQVVGLEFTTDNSGLIGDSVQRWLEHIRQPSDVVLTYFRGGPLAGAAATRRTLQGAFAFPWWLMASIGLAMSRRTDREWALALVLAGLLPTIVLLSLLPLPRLAYYMYPAIYLLAARGALGVGAFVSWTSARLGLQPAVRRGCGGLAVALPVAVLVVTANLDLLGSQALNVAFHFSTGL